MKASGRESRGANHEAVNHEAVTACAGRAGQAGQLTDRAGKAPAQSAQPTQPSAVQQQKKIEELEEERIALKSNWESARNNLERWQIELQSPREHEKRAQLVDKSLDMHGDIKRSLIIY